MYADIYLVDSYNSLLYLNLYYFYIDNNMSVIVKMEDQF